MTEKGTVVPLPPSVERLEQAARLEKPQNFVPSTSTAAKEWGTGGPARAMMPVGVVGELGSSYTVFEKNWQCGDCHTDNYASKQRCLRCRARKPAGGGGLVHGAAAMVDAAADGEEAEVDPNAAVHGEWKEIFDATARHLYYFNTATGETQWDRPAVMGPTPHSSGWFGRGAAGSNAAAGYERNNAEYIQRPSRKQIDYIPSKNSVLEGAYEYNIWWGKHVGEHWDSGANKEPAETRCVLATDAGYTKADKMTRGIGTSNFCIFFARGCCALGPECRFFHRLPVQADLDRFAKDEMHDIFGRERHKDFRDDMTGVGSISKPCRTLYVGGLLKAEYADPGALEEALWRNFGEFGEVENINLISRLSICFARYRYRSHAEFAKIALSNNHVDRAENMNIRWAHEDPNPVAHDSAARADADALVEMLKARGVAITNAAGDTAGMEHPGHYALPLPKRLKSGHEGDALLSSYPDTDEQFSEQPDLPAGGWKQVPHPDAPGTSYWWHEATGETSNDVPGDVADASCDAVNAALDAADALCSQAQLPYGWSETQDPASGESYYYHAQTGQTSWDIPVA
ncbi:hypothetical protein M885DRAFT_614423 [Pelagophyceae sp. CCMP2097]|nr:hypothetical protein M885DRAFT_614423 [Pelagophyceae sp. CCMP2097]